MFKWHNEKKSPEKKPPARPPPPQKVSPILLERPSPSFTALFEQNITTCKDFQNTHDSAYRYIDSGLQNDQANKVSLAIENYTKGLHLLNKVLLTDVTKLIGCSRNSIARAQEMQIKMNKTKQEISSRLQSLQERERPEKSFMASAPPSYEEALNQAEQPPPYDEDELTQLGESLMHRELSSDCLSDAEEIFCIADGVQLYYISPVGLVSAPTYPTALHVLKLKDRETAPIFLSVGDWVYPLIPGQSPALESTYGAYLFPDTSSSPGSAIGLILPDSLATSERVKFHLLLQKLTLLEVQSASSTEVDESLTSLSQLEKQELSKVSKGILIAASWISWGVLKGAEKAENLIKKGSHYIQTQTRRCSENYAIDPNVKKGVVYARQATNGAVKVTGYIVNKLGEATVLLAKEIAPYIRKQSYKVLPRALTEEGSGSPSAIDTVVEVAVSGLKGFSKVYCSLEKAAKSLGSSLVDETVDVVRHNYGEEAAELTENTMCATGNVFMTAHNVNNLGLKAIAKRTAKETGQAVFDEMKKAKGTMIE